MTLETDRQNSSLERNPDVRNYSVLEGFLELFSGGGEVGVLRIFQRISTLSPHLNPPPGVVSGHKACGYLELSHY